MKNPQAIKTIILVALLVKILYFAIAFSVANFTEFDFKERATFRSKSPEVTKLLYVFYRNDTQWYFKIASKGHNKITEQELPSDKNPYYQSYYAFFPAYPFSMRACMTMTGDYSEDNFVVFAFFTSIIFSIACFICFFFFAKEYFQDTEKGFTAALLLIIFPFHYYYSMYYTEALFMLLTISCFIAINKERYGILYILACLLVSTRPNGILIGLPLVLWILQKANWKLPQKQLIRIAILGLVMSLTLLAYCLYLKHMTGDYFVFSTAQKGWGRKLANPFSTLWNVDSTKDIVLSLYTVLFILITVFSYKKFNPSFLSLILIGIFMPITYGIVMSMPRFIIVLFPFMLLFTQYMTTLPRLRKNTIFGVLFSVHIVTYLTWLFATEFSY